MKAIEKRIQSGHGQGWGKDYLPWLTVQDVPSQGISTRILGIKIGRKHELFSVQSVIEVALTTLERFKT